MIRIYHTAVFIRKTPLIFRPYFELLKPERDKFCLLASIFTMSDLDDDLLALAGFGGAGSAPSAKQLDREIP